MHQQAGLKVVLASGASRLFEERSPARQGAELMQAQTQSTELCYRQRLLVGLHDLQLFERLGYGDPAWVIPYWRVA